MAHQITEAHDARTCDSALANVFDFLGKRGNGIILGTPKTASSGFAELNRAVSGISDSVLSKLLTELAGAGIVERTVDAGPPVSVSYRVSASGLALLPARDQIGPWARLNLAKP